MEVLSYLLGKKSGGGGGGSSYDWSAIGLNQEPAIYDDVEAMNKKISDGYNYALTIKEEFDPTQSVASKYKNDDKLVFFPTVETSQITSWHQTFYGCKNLSEVSYIDTSEVTTFNSTFSGCNNLEKIASIDTGKAKNCSMMFYACKSLKYLPQLDLSSATSLASMFGDGGASSLTDESVDNLLKSLISATKFTGTKNMPSLGITSSSYLPASRIQACPSYQAFLDAGWTIGY